MFGGTLLMPACSHQSNNVGQKLARNDIYLNAAKILLLGDLWCQVISVAIICRCWNKGRAHSSQRVRAQDLLITTLSLRHRLIRTVALQQGGPHFKSWPGVFMKGDGTFSLCSCGFSLGTTPSSKYPNTWPLHVNVHLCDCVCHCCVVCMPLCRLVMERWLVNGVTCLPAGVRQDICPSK